MVRKFRPGLECFEPRLVPAVRVFTGTDAGNPAHWGGTLPVNLDRIEIRGTAGHCALSLIPDLTHVDFLQVDADYSKAVTVMALEVNEVDVKSGTFQVFDSLRIGNGTIDVSDSRGVHFDNIAGATVTLAGRPNLDLNVVGGGSVTFRRAITLGGGGGNVSFNEILVTGVQVDEADVITVTQHPTIRKGVYFDGKSELLLVDHLHVTDDSIVGVRPNAELKVTGHVTVDEGSDLYVGGNAHLKVSGWQPATEIEYGVTKNLRVAVHCWGAGSRVLLEGDRAEVRVDENYLLFQYGGELGLSGTGEDGAFKYYSRIGGNVYVGFEGWLDFYANSEGELDVAGRVTFNGGTYRLDLNHHESICDIVKFTLDCTIIDSVLEVAAHGTRPNQELFYTYLEGNLANPQLVGSWNEPGSTIPAGSDLRYNHQGAKAYVHWPAAGEEESDV